jgi:hypothetical protein
MKFLSPFLACFIVLFIGYFPSGAQVPVNTETDSLLAGMSKTLRWKIVYSSIDRGRNGIPSLKTKVFHSENADTFSAAMVHLPLAAWVLEKASAEKEAGYDLNSTMISEASYGEQMPAYNDPRWPDGRPTLARYLRNMLLLRDAQSYNRLYEYAGQEYLLHTAYQRGLHIRYCRRLGETDENNARHTNPVDFYDGQPRRVYAQSEKYNGNEYPKFPGESVASPSNLVTPESLHGFMISLVFPQTVRSVDRTIDAAQRKFLLRYSSQWPEETEFPLYGRDECPNAFFEALLPEDSMVRVFATGGEEGTQIVESAFVIDTASHVEFLLTVAADAGKVENLENAYALFEYCGNRILEAERKRKKAIFPDLSDFIISYDK